MQHMGVAQTLGGLPLPAIQLIEALQALQAGDEGADRARLAQLFGRPADDPEIDATLQVLAQRAFAWADGDRVYLLPALRRVFQCPLGLGRPVADQLAEHT